MPCWCVRLAHAFLCVVLQVALWEEAWAAVQASSKYTDDEEGEVASAFATHLQVRTGGPISYYYFY